MMPKFEPTLPHQQIKIWVESGLSMSEVARRLGKNVGSISNFCKKHNIKSKFQQEEKDIPIEEAKSLYDDGLSFYKLGKKYNRPPALIKKKLLKAYPDLDTRTMDEAKRPPLLNDANLLASEMRVKSLRSIAKELGVKISTVGNAAKRLGIDGLIRDQTVTDSPEDVRLLYDSGIGLTELADTYNTYPTTIANIIKRVGGELRPQGGAPRQSKYDELNDKEWLVDQYHNHDRSMSFIALYLGTSVGNVSHMFRKHGIKKKSKKKVYSKLRRRNAKIACVSTKWGKWKLQSQQESDFVQSLNPSHKVVKHEPVTLSACGSDYTPDFYVDGEYIEIKPLNYAVKPGIDRQRFVKQIAIAKLNNIDIKLWYKGRYVDYCDISDIDEYFALNWKLFFADADECCDFLLGYGFKPIKWNHDTLLRGLNKLHTVPEPQWLNANYNNENVTNLIRHFNSHFWYSSHKEYNAISRAFDDDNSMVLRRSLREIWNKTRGVNIYRLFKHIAKFSQNFMMPSIFKPWVAKYVYNSLLSNGGVVVDPCMGWGGRFLGTVGYDIKYVGFDLNVKAVEANTKIAAFVGAASMHEPTFSVADASTVKWPKGDLLFTSPPYDDLEYYDGLEKQCEDTTPIYENVMKFDGIIAINIPKKHRDKCISIAEVHGRKLVNEYKMKTASLAGMREKTYEPILVFK